jgi:hypothetical protein
MSDPRNLGMSFDSDNQGVASELGKCHVASSRPFTSLECNTSHAALLAVPGFHLVHEA